MLFCIWIKDNLEYLHFVPTILWERKNPDNIDKFQGEKANPKVVNELVAQKLLCV